MKLVEFAEVVSAMAKLHPEAEVLVTVPEWDCYIPVAVRSGVVVPVQIGTESYYVVESSWEVRRPGQGMVFGDKVDALLLEYA